MLIQDSRLAFGLFVSTCTLLSSCSRSAATEGGGAPSAASALVRRDPPAALPGAVVVRSLQNSGGEPFEIRCMPTERLLSGSCSGRSFAPQSMPVGYADTDTRGAGWRCVLPNNAPGAGEAFALCQGVADAAK